MIVRSEKALADVQPLEVVQPLAFQSDLPDRSFNQLVIRSLLQVALVQQPDSNSSARPFWIAGCVLLDLFNNEPFIPRHRRAIYVASRYFIARTVHSMPEPTASAALETLRAVKDALHQEGVPQVLLEPWQRVEELGMVLERFRHVQAPLAKQVIVALDLAVSTAKEAVIDALYILLVEDGDQAPLSVWFREQAREASHSA